MSNYKFGGAYEEEKDKLTFNNNIYYVVNKFIVYWCEGNIDKRCFQFT